MTVWEQARSLSRAGVKSNPGNGTPASSNSKVQRLLAGQPQCEVAARLMYKLSNTSLPSSAAQDRR